jgi:hypothetical protein
VPNTNYCGGSANQQIRLADGDAWINGTVTGTIPTTQQRGALECSGSCTLVGVNVLVTTASWAAFYTPGADLSRVISITGGRFSGAGSLGIGPSSSTFTLTGVEIDHNGSGSARRRASDTPRGWSPAPSTQRCTARSNSCERNSETSSLITASRCQPRAARSLATRCANAEAQCADGVRGVTCSSTHVWRRQRRSPSTATRAFGAGEPADAEAVHLHHLAGMIHVDAPLGFGCSTNRFWWRCMTRHQPQPATARVQAVAA